MSGVKLHPSAMSGWVLLSASGNINKYRPSGEDIYLKRETGMKFEDEIYIVPCSAVEVTLNWVDNLLVKVTLKAVLFVNYSDPAIKAEVKWYLEDGASKPCSVACYDGRDEYEPQGQLRTDLLHRLVLLVKTFPQLLRNKILKSLKELHADSIPKVEEVVVGVPDVPAVSVPASKSKSRPFNGFSSAPNGTKAWAVAEGKRRVAGCAPRKMPV